MDKSDMEEVRTIHDALVRMSEAYGQYQVTGNAEAYFDDIARAQGIMSNAVHRILWANRHAL